MPVWLKHLTSAYHPNPSVDAIHLKRHWLPLNCRSQEQSKRKQLCDGETVPSLFLPFLFAYTAECRMSGHETWSAHSWMLLWQATSNPRDRKADLTVLALWGSSWACLPFHPVLSAQELVTNHLAMPLPTVLETMTNLCHLSSNCRKGHRFLNRDYLKFGMRWWDRGTELQEHLGSCEDTGPFSLLFSLLKLFLWKHISCTNNTLLQLIWCLMTHGVNFVTIRNLSLYTSGFAVVRSCADTLICWFPNHFAYLKWGHFFNKCSCLGLKNLCRLVLIDLAQ